MVEDVKKMGNNSPSSSTIEDGSDIEKVNAAVEFATFVSNYTENDIVEAMGGDDASVMDVVTFAMGIIQGAYPKN